MAQQRISERLYDTRGWLTYPHLSIKYRVQNLQFTGKDCLILPPAEALTLSPGRGSRDLEFNGIPVPSLRDLTAAPFQE